MPLHSLKDFTRDNGKTLTEHIHTIGPRGRNHPVLQRYKGPKRDFLNAQSSLFCYYCRFDPHEWEASCREVRKEPTLRKARA